MNTHSTNQLPYAVEGRAMPGLAASCHERLLHGMAAALAHLAASGDRGAALERVLETIGSAMEADQVSLYRDQAGPSTEARQARLCFFWTSGAGAGDGAPADHRPLASLSYEDLPRWHQVLTADETILGRVEGLPRAERRVLAPLGAHAVLALPLCASKVFQGFLLVVTRDPGVEWTLAEASLLRALTTSLADACAQRASAPPAAPEPAAAETALVVCHGETFHFVYFNKYFTRRFGYATDLPPEHDFFSLFESKQAGQRVLTRLRRHGAFEGEVTIRTRLGAPVPTFLRAYPLRSESHQPAGFAAVLEPLAEREGAPPAHRSHTQMLSHIQEAVISVDRRGRVTFFNRGAARFFDVDPEDALGRSFGSLLGDEERHGGQLFAILRSLRASGAWQGETTITLRNGEKRQVALALKLLDPGGAGGHLIAVIRDLTATKQQEARIEHRLRVEGALVEASRLLVASGKADFTRLLRIIGESIGAERAYLITIPPDDQLLGMASEDAGGTVTVWHRDVGELSDEALHAFRASFEPEDVLRAAPEDLSPPKVLQREPSAVAVPILSTDDRLYGYLGIEHGQDQPPRDWYEEDMRVLSVLGDMLCTYLERDIAEQALRESEERWRRLVESHPEPILITLEDVIAYVNPSGAGVLGFARPEDLVGRSLFDFISAELHGLIEQRLHALMRGAALAPLQHEIIRLDGEDRIVESFSIPIVFRGQPAAQTVLRDITERKKSEERYGTFVETISEGICHFELVRPIATSTLTRLQVPMIQEYGRLAECNEVMARFFNVAHPDQLAGRPLRKFMPDANLVRDFVASGYRLRNREYSAPRRGQRARHVVINAVGTVERGQLVRIWGSCIDVTERVELERQMLTALEEQQQRIGQDLHDGVGQLLTGVRMLSQNLAENVPADVEHHTQANKIARFAEEASRHVRDIYRGLTPVQLFQEGLAAALEELAHNTDVLPNIDCTFVHDGQAEVTDRDTILHLYRIAQEATNNALKHAEAAHISIVFRLEDEQIVVAVEDNGVGFDPEAGRGKTRSLGLDSMHYRARTIKATLDIASQPGQGTTVRCALPRHLHTTHASPSVRSMK